MRMFSRKRALRSLAAVGAASLVFSLIVGNSMVSAAGLNTLSVTDGGDGVINATEISSVTASGTADPVITAIDVRFYNDAACSVLLGSELNMFAVGGLWSTSNWNFSAALDGDLCVTAEYYDSTSTLVDAETLLSTIDTVGPTIALAILDGGDGVDGTEAAAGVDVEYSADELGSTVDFEVTNTVDPATSNCLAAAQPAAPVAGTAIYTIPTACFGDLASGPFDVSASNTDLAGNPSAPATAASTFARSAGDVIAEILDGADDTFPYTTGRINNVANAEETNDAADLGVLVSLSASAVGIVTATVTATDAASNVTSTVKQMESTSDDETRTVSIDARGLDQGEIDVEVSIIDSLGGTSETAATTTLDISAPQTIITDPADGDSFIFLGIPTFFDLFSREIDFTGTTNDNLSVVQYTYLTGENETDGRTFATHATMSNRNSSTITWDKAVSLSAGEWTVTACSMDKAGNIETNCPTVSFVMDGVL